MILQVMVELTLKATAVLITAHVLSFLFRKASPAVIHWIWLLALLSILVIPFARLTVLPAVLHTPLLASSINDPVLAVVSIARTAPNSSPFHGAKLPHFYGRREQFWYFWRLLWGVLLYSLTRRARPAPLSASPSQRISVSDDISIPQIWGWLSRTILIPASALEWPPTRLAAAIANEPAHIERRDWVSQMAGAIACAFYWFHPLVWIAASLLAAAAEMARDGRVLAPGMAAPEYASELLEIARIARPPLICRSAWRRRKPWKPAFAPFSSRAPSNEVCPDSCGSVRDRF